MLVKRPVVEEKTPFVVLPVEGRPHPNSPGEQLLARHPKNPLTSDQVLERAIALRQLVAVPDVGPLPPVGAGLEAVLMS